MRPRPTFTILVLLALLALLGALRLCVGPAGVGLPTDGAAWELRGIRVAGAALVGIALASGGVMLQCLLRNPLASPDLMGLASGAGLGVVVATYISALAGFGALSHGATAFSALSGSLASLVLVYTLSQRRGLIEPVTLILIGVIVSVVAGSGTVFVQSLMPDRGTSASRWLLGSLSDELTWPQLAWGAAAVLLMNLLAWTRASAMDAMSLSDDEARSVGVPLGRVRVLLLAGSGVLAAAAVVIAGPIGFVGLVCPHLVRMGAGPSHRVLLPGAAIAGAALVVGADVLVRTLTFDSGRMPLGVITAMLGGPVLIAMLRASGGPRM